MVHPTKILGGPWHGRTLLRRPPWLHPFPNFCEHLFHAPLTEGSYEQRDSESEDTQTQTPAITLAYLAQAIMHVSATLQRQLRDDGPDWDGDLLRCSENRKIFI